MIMKQLLIYKIKKSQAILELAIFSSIIFVILGFIVSYGQQFNYAQSVEMRAFHRTMTHAYVQGRFGEYIDPTVTMINIEDRPYADVSDPFGFLDYRPVNTTHSMSWSNDLMMPGEIADWGNPHLLPHVILNINQLKDPLGIGLNSKSYYIATANYKICNLSPGFFSYRIRCSDGGADATWDGGYSTDIRCNLVELILNGEDCIRKKRPLPTLNILTNIIGGWPFNHSYWTAVFPVGIEAKHEDQEYFAVAQNHTYDVDGDGKEERVIGGLPANPWEEFIWSAIWALIQEFLELIDMDSIIPLLPELQPIGILYVMDFQEGEIDFSQGTDVQRYGPDGIEGTPDDDILVPPPGLQPGYVKKLSQSGSLSKTEGIIGYADLEVPGIETVLTREQNDDIYRWVRLTNKRVTLFYSVDDFLDNMGLGDWLEILTNPSSKIREWLGRFLISHLLYFDVEEQVLINNAMAAAEYAIREGVPYADAVRALEDKLDKVIYDNGPDGIQGTNDDGRWLRLYVGHQRRRRAIWRTPWNL